MLTCLPPFPALPPCSVAAGITQRVLLDYLSEYKYWKQRAGWTLPAFSWCVQLLLRMPSLAAEQARFAEGSLVMAHQANGSPWHNAAHPSSTPQVPRPDGWWRSGHRHPRQQYEVGQPILPSAA